MSRETAIVLVVLVLLWWSSPTAAAAPATGPTQAYSPGVGAGPNHWWAPCPPGYVQIPPFGDCLPPNTTGAPFPIY
jgi:hypothetical protein